MTESLFALLGTVFAGAGLKFFDWLVNRKTERRIAEEKARQDAREGEKVDAADRRQQILDLRDELNQVRKEIDAREAEMLEWREKYWTLREEQVNTLTTLNEALNKIKELTGNGDSKTQV